MHVPPCMMMRGEHPATVRRLRVAALSVSLTRISVYFSEFVGWGRNRAVPVEAGVSNKMVACSVLFRHASGCQVPRVLLCMAAVFRLMCTSALCGLVGW
jgi:hypothetical protein